MINRNPVLLNIVLSVLLLFPFVQPLADEANNAVLSACGVVEKNSNELRDSLVCPFVPTYYMSGRFKLSLFQEMGSFQRWQDSTIRKYEEYSIGDDVTFVADNGQYEWSVKNGRLSITTDERRLISRKVDSLISENAFCDSLDTIFDIRNLGIVNWNGNSCFGVSISNRLNDDRFVSFYDSESFLEIRTEHYESEAKLTETIMRDYREIEGVKFPFYVRTTFVTEGMYMELFVDSIIMNISIDQNIFEPHVE